MKACRIEVSTELFLTQLGLENPKDIIIFAAQAHPKENYLTLFLTGEYEGLPEVAEGEEIPYAHIECTRIISKIKVHTPLLKQ